MNNPVKWMLILAAALVCAPTAWASSYVLAIPQMIGTGEFGSVDNLAVTLSPVDPITHIYTGTYTGNTVGSVVLQDGVASSFSVEVQNPGTYTVLPTGFNLTITPDDIVTASGIGGISANGLVLGLYDLNNTNQLVLAYDLFLHSVSANQIDFILWNPNDAATLDTGVFQSNIVITPEPNVLFLLGTGILGLAVMAFRRHDISHHRMPQGALGAA